MPHTEEAQTKINQIKSAKNIDDTQATIEFLTAYVPEIKWWEINSLSELDEKIKLVNSKTGFPPFSEVPEVDKFNQEVEKNFGYKSLAFLVSVIPRENDRSIDWKGLDFQNYSSTIMEPLMESRKFKPSFATQENYREISRRLKEEINSLLASLCSQFSSLASASELNNLTETLLSKFFQGHIYAEFIHDELGQQLNVANHQKFVRQKTGKQSANIKWGIILNEFAFKGGSEPNPDPSGDEYQLLVNDLNLLHERLTAIKDRKEHEYPDLKWLNNLSFGEWIKYEKEAKNGLPEIEKLQTELSNHSADKPWITQTRTNIRRKYEWLFKK